MGAPVSKIEAAEEKTAEELLSAFKHMAPAERRTHASVYNYWQSIRRDRELPPIRDLDALEISEAAPHGVLLELAEGGEDAQILHIGEALRDGVQTSALSDAPEPSALSCIGGKLGIVKISKDALAFEDHFLASDGTTRCSVTLLPFSASGDTVDFVYALVTLETGVTFLDEASEAIAEKTEAAPEAVADESEQVEAAIAEEPEPVADSAQEDQAPTAQDEIEIEAEAQAAVVPDPAELDALSAPEPATGEQAPEAASEAESADEFEIPQFLTEPQPTVEPEAKPGFSKIFDALAGAKGFFGTVAPSEPEHAPEPEVEAVAEEPAVEDPVVEEPVPEAPVAEELEGSISEAEPAIQDEVEEPAPVAEDLSPVADEATPEEPAPAAEEPIFTEEPVETPSSAMEGTLQSKLTDVRSKADEARAARLRSEALLVEGLSAAYDFALDAEDAPEEYLKLVEGQGLKIQLRSPMKPVAKLAFNGMCDDMTIKQLEAILAWAFDEEVPRGTLAERIETEGGIAPILNREAKAA